jgi:hypothetical protein
MMPADPGGSEEHPMADRQGVWRQIRARAATRAEHSERQQ